MSDNIMLRCFLYCAQVLWEKWCLYNKSCSYGNQGGRLFVEDPGACFGSDSCEVDSMCLCSFTGCGWSRCKHDLSVWVFFFVTDSWRWILLTLHVHAHALFHWTMAFDDSLLILSLSSWTVASDPTDFIAAGWADITGHDGRGSSAAPIAGLHSLSLRRPPGLK